MKPHTENSKISIDTNRRPMSSYRYNSLNKSKIFSSRESIREFTNKNLFKEKDQSRIFNSSFNFKNNFHSNRQHDETEKLFEECLQLKSNMNKMNKELILLKSDLLKKETENKKLNDMLKNNLSDNNYYNGNDFIREKIKIYENNNLVINLKKEYNLLKREYEKREKEIQEIKQTSKFIRLRELQIENQILSEEYRKIRTQNEELIEKLQQQEKEIYNLKENYKNQSHKVEDLQKEIKLLNENKSIENHNDKMNYRYEFSLDRMKQFRSNENTFDKKSLNMNFSLNMNKSLKKKIKIKNKIESSANNTKMATNSLTINNFVDTNFDATNPSYLNKTLITNENECNNKNDNISINRMTQYQIKLFTLIILIMIEKKGSDRKNFSDVKFLNIIIKLFS